MRTILYERNNLTCVHMKSGSFHIHIFLLYVHAETGKMENAKIKCCIRCLVSVGRRTTLFNLQNLVQEEDEYPRLVLGSRGCSMSQRFGRYITGNLEDICKFANCILWWFLMGFESMATTHDFLSLFNCQFVPSTV